MVRIIAIFFMLFTFNNLCFSETVHLSIELSDQSVSVNSITTADTLATTSVAQVVVPNRIMPPSVITKAYSVEVFLGYSESTIEIVSGCTFFSFGLKVANTFTS